MKTTSENRCKHDHTSGHRGQGPSSFWMQDPDLVFDALGLAPGDRVLDMGCGAGDYVIKAADLVGASGLVVALDHWPPIIDAMKKAAQGAGLDHIRALVADITQPLPVKENDMDICLIFTVLHIFGLQTHGEKIYREVSRVLKPGGRLAVVECKKEEMPFGPPVHMRLSPEEVEASIQGFGFKKTGFTDLGYNYLIQFSLV